MAEYTDEQLLEFTRGQAEEELTDEQMHRYNSLKAQKLQDNIDEYKGDKAEENLDGLGQIVEDVKEDMISTVNLAGNEVRVLVDPDNQEFSTIQSLRQYSELSDKQITGDKSDEIKEKVLDLVGQFTVDYTAEEWKQSFDEQNVGVRGTIEVAEKIVSVVEEEVEQKKRR